MLKEVLITVSNIKVPQTYLSKSYPDRDRNNNGKTEMYTTPVYKVFIDGEDLNYNKVRKEWLALRFLPFWNDPKEPKKKYAGRGFINSGLTYFPKTPVSLYNPKYGVQNSYSPFAGAIQITKNFLIHAGPFDISIPRWGGAGCVEIIGNFDDFKDDIKILSGSNLKDTQKALSEIVSARKLFVKVDYAVSPDFQTMMVGEHEGGL